MTDGKESGSATAFAGATFFAALAAGSIVAWLGVAPSALATNVPSVKTHIVDIDVKVGDALKPYPGLFDNCAAEAKSYAAAMQAQADKEHRDDPSAFHDGTAWTMTAPTRCARRSENYVSIVRTDDMFEAARTPEPQGRYHSLGHARRKKRISIRPFFTETADNGPTMNALAANGQAIGRQPENRQRDSGRRRGHPCWSTSRRRNICAKTHSSATASSRRC